MPAISHPHLLIDPDGFPVTAQGVRFEDNDFREKELPRIFAEIENHILSQSQKTKPKLLIYVHGGLTGHRETLDEIKWMAPALKEMNLYPVFVNWNSSFGSTWWDDIFEVRHGERQPILGVLTSPFVLMNRVVSAVITAPISIGYQFDVDKTICERFPREDEESSIRHCLAETLKFVATFPTRTFSIPFLSAFGTGAWEMMKRRIDQMLAVNIDTRDRRNGALRAFLKELTTKKIPKPGIWKTDTGDEIEIDLTLAGHSMGAIVVNHILREFPTIKFDRIIYLAAASSIDEFRNSVVPHLTLYKETRFYSFSLARLDESQEGNPHPSSLYYLIPNFFPFNDFLARGSLLVWIDNMFEPGLATGHKRLGWWRNRTYVTVDQKDKQLCSRITFLKFDGLNSDPTRHGEFNDKGVFQTMFSFAVPNVSNSWREQECPTCVFNPC